MPTHLLCYMQNEEENIYQTLQSVCNQRGCEVILVDGGSSDSTVDIARRWKCPKVISTDKGRARQMNAGAQKAKGDVLLFLHGDSKLPPDWDNDVRQILQEADQQQHAPQWGCFKTINPDMGPLGRWVLTWAVSLRTCLLHRPYGDQALFVRQQAFHDIGTYPDLPLLEDLELVKRLKKQYGAPAIVPRAVDTSGRRWQRLGLVQTTVINQLILIGHALGVDTHALAHLYGSGKQQGGKKKKPI